MLRVRFCLGPPLQVAGCRSGRNSDFSVFSSLLALCLLANSEIWKQTESEQNSARSLHDCVGIRGNDTILDDILPSPTTH